MSPTKLITTHFALSVHGQTSECESQEHNIIGSNECTSDFALHEKSVTAVHKRSCSTRVLGRRLGKITSHRYTELLNLYCYALNLLFSGTQCVTNSYRICSAVYCDEALWVPGEDCENIGKHIQ